MDSPIAYKVTIYKLKANKSEKFEPNSIENIHYTTNRDYDVDCSNLDKEADVDCEPVTLIRMRVLNPGDYLFQVEINSLMSWQPYIKEVGFETNAVSETFVTVTITIRIILFCFSLVLVLMFEWQFQKHKPSRNLYSYEMNWTRALNICLMLYLEPVSVLNSINPSTFS